MAIISEYTSYDAIGLTELIQKKEIHPKDVIESAITQINKHNPNLNAIVEFDFERARSQAQSKIESSPFFGVPFLLKDLLGEDKGRVSTASCPPMKDWKASEDSEMVRRFKESGLRILGRTNTPQLGIYGVTESEFRGICKNPWNNNHTPGGSSGGAACAVASGMVPIAHGGDGGGSIRIPAAHCGLVGLKTTRGLQPAGPFRGERWNGFVCEGVLTKSVRDTARALDVTSGMDIGAPYSVPKPDQSYETLMKLTPKKCKIAFCKEALFGEDTHPDNIAALEHTLSLLENLGHTVIEAKPNFDRESLIRAYFVVVATGVGLGIRQMEDKLQRKIAESELEMPSWALATIAEKVSAAEYSWHVDKIFSESRKIAHFFEEYDLFVTPTAACPPVQIGSFGMGRREKLQIQFLRRFPIRKLIDMAIEQLATNALNATPNTMIFNQTGQPAISVPLYWNSKNLPIGTQIVGGYAKEALLLQIAHQLEIAQPWMDRYQTIH